jgi:hypothetical protein
MSRVHCTKRPPHTRYSSDALVPANAIVLATIRSAEIGEDQVPYGATVGANDMMIGG